jgi:hypothetical protein
MYAIGCEKGQLLDQVLSDLRPRVALEIGTFLGYSAVRTARQLAPNGLLICIEANPDNAAVARQVVDHAGVGDRVVILGGLGNEKLPEAARLVAAASSSSSTRPGKQQGGERVLAALQRQAEEREAAAAGESPSGQAAAAAAAAAADGDAEAPAALQDWMSNGTQVDYLFLDHW